MKKYLVISRIAWKDGDSVIERDDTFECNSYYFTKESLGKTIVLEDCNNAKNGKQFKRNRHIVVEKHFKDIYHETIIIEKSTGEEVLRIA